MTTEPFRTTRRASVTAWRNGDHIVGERSLPEETAIALTYGRATHAVMLASPGDLEDFAYGFSLNEGIVQSAGELEAVEIVARPAGIELRMDVADTRMDALAKRRRHLTGATGCGLCGMESLAEAGREPHPVPRTARQWSAHALAGVSEALVGRQPLNGITHATHAAAFWTEPDGIVCVREDVGRHNALDKLAGALALAAIRPEGGIVVLTSRVSVEMVQKAAMMRAPMLLAFSAPTALARDAAERAGITLIGVARRDGFEVFTHAWRIRNACGTPAGRPAMITATP